jgi:hypothetical protein
MPDDPVRFLTSWYAARCNGFWEHGNGITIETLATPGWGITIDLSETPLEEASMPPYSVRRSPHDWVACKVEHRRFVGEGDPTKLGVILQVFQGWASRHATVK